MTSTSEKKQRALNASSLRIVLFIIVFIILVGTGIGFSYGLQILDGYAVEVSHKKADARASNENIRAYQQLEKELEDNKDVLKKARALQVNSEFPEFRIVDEVKAVAQKNNIDISSFSYGDTSTADAAQGTAPAAPTDPATPAVPAVASNSNTFSLTINFSGGVSYDNFLQFLYDTEQNVPKLQVKSVSISGGGAPQSSDGQAAPAPTGNTDTVTVEALTIEMYVKK